MSYPTSLFCQLPEDNDIIDLTKLDFNDDESWLWQCSKNSVIDLKQWLYKAIPENASVVSIKTTKNVDNQAFTPPKKCFTSPSIKKHNKKWYENKKRELEDSGIQLNRQDKTSTSSFNFNFLPKAPSSLNSFQNMSPPSLVNSMSSTFANLMENSFIKNDSELREIRDMNSTRLNLQQDAELTQNCSTLNTDVPKHFLKKVSFVEERDKTFAKEDNDDDNQSLDRDAKLTFQRQTHSNHEDLNSLITLSEKPESGDKKTVKNMKRLHDRHPSRTPDLNHLSYLAETEENTTFKRNFFGPSDSVENLNYMSLKSSRSSRPKSMYVLNDLDAPTMSTPKQRAKIRWPHHELSPIRDLYSDPKLSFIDQHTPPLRKQKTVSHIAQNIPNPKSVNTLPVEKKPIINSMGHVLKGSYTSLKPTNANLPVAPPPLDTTAGIKYVTVIKGEVLKEIEFVKSPRPKSGLPRPVTSIPRPVSRIPGPTNLGLGSKSAGTRGRY